MVANVQTLSAPAAPVSPGTRVVSVRVVPTPRYTRREVGVYEATPRKCDGLLTWRLVVSRREGGWTENAAARAGRQVAETLGLQFAPGVRHGSVVA